MLLGFAVDVPDDLAPAAVSVAERTLALVDDGERPADAYRAALVEAGLWGTR